jgi:hypothetical protein
LLRPVVTHSEQSDLLKRPALNVALEIVRAQILHYRTQTGYVHHPGFGIIPDQQSLVRQEKYEVDHVLILYSIRADESFPDSRQNLSASPSPANICGSTIESANESLESYVDQFIITNARYRSQPFEASVACYAVESHEQVLHLATETFVFQHSRLCRYS